MENNNTVKQHKIKWWIPACIIVGVLVVIMAVCVRVRFSKEAIAKRALKKKYNEDFVIHEIDSWGKDWEVTASPKNNPEVLFHSKILQEGVAENDEYFRCYVKHLMEDTVENDLKALYPDSFFRMREVYLRWEGGNKSYSNMTMEEIIDNSTILYDAPGGDGCYLDIYINREACPSMDYKREYEYFTKTMDEYIEEKKMLPITVTFFYVDCNVVNNLENYFKKDIDIDSVFANEVLCVDYFQRGNITSEKTDLGNPPNVIVCFKKDSEYYIGNYENYKGRRELLENAP